MDWQTDENANVGETTVTISGASANDGASEVSASFTITVTKNCLYATITPSEVIDHYYKVGDGQRSYQYPEFGNSDEELCPLTYHWDYDIFVMTSWTYTLEPRTLVWSNYSNNVYTGVYPVGAFATNEAGLSARIDYTIYVDPNCVR